MEIDINPDFKTLQQKYGLTVSQCQELEKHIIEGLTIKTYENWKDLTSKELNQLRDAYLSGLIYEENENGDGIVYLDTSFAKIIENGCSPFDMKIGFSQSPKIRVKKNGGWYLIIPIPLIQEQSPVTPTQNLLRNFFTKWFGGKIGNVKKISKISFRTVSDKSKSDSWIHPGFTPRNFMTRSFEMIDVEKEKQNLIVEYLNNL